VIYSFSKAFPMPYGGLLKSRRPTIHASALSAAAQDQLPRLVAYYLSNLAAAGCLRCEFFDQYKERFAAEGFRPLFEPGPGVVPHSFIVAMPDQKTAEAMKPQLRSAGINSSVFYGGGGYFLPNHQSLSKAAIDYIVAHFVTAFNRAARLQ
jgi:hypothetical protein